MKGCVTGLSARSGPVSLLNSSRLPVGRYIQRISYNQTNYCYAREVVHSNSQLNVHERSCVCAFAGAGAVIGSGNCAKRQSPIYTQMHMYICAHAYAHVQVHVQGSAQVMSDTWERCLPAGLGGGVTVPQGHLQVS